MTKEIYIMKDFSLIYHVENNMVNANMVEMYRSIPTEYKTYWENCPREMRNKVVCITDEEIEE